MRLIFYSLLFLLVPVLALAQATAAEPTSPCDTTASHRPTLLVFSGSDWCQPCIRFEKEVLLDPVFQTFVAANLELVKADFPQRKKRSKAEQQENERLAEQYNPAGKFPHIVLLRPDQSVLAVLPSNAVNGAAFVSIIQNYWPQK